MLRDAGYNVAATLAYRDHHPYSNSDASRVAAAARAAGTDTVLTTQKDLVRWEALGELPFSPVAVPLVLDIDGWEALSESIDQALARAREAA